MSNLLALVNSMHDIAAHHYFLLPHGAGYLDRDAHLSRGRIGIPVEVLFLSYIPETITVSFLGLILIFYVIYSAFILPLPALTNPNWAFFFGFLSGMGGGAYNTAAPSMIIYADTQCWEPRLFKGNLQGCFLIFTMVAILTHALNGNITPDVLQKSLVAIPFVLIESVTGFYLDRFINPDVFRKIVLIL